MMKGLLLGILTMVLLVLMSFGNKDEHERSITESKKTEIVPMKSHMYVMVDNLSGLSNDSISVFLYKNRPINKIIKPQDAEIKAFTNGEGIAEFDLDMNQMGIIEDATMLYFAVFYRITGETHVVGTSGITMENGDEKYVRIVIPV